MFFRARQKIKAFREKGWYVNLKKMLSAIKAFIKPPLQAK
jgi:hypothetical protein